MYKDPDKQVIALCRHCGHRLELVPGKVQRQFCNDACRKAYKRAELKEFEVVAGSSVAEPRTDGTKQPRTLTPDKPKRGKDIKTFADLPPDVQKTIDKMAMVEGKIDKTIKANRTAIAVNYQHLFPGRPYTGV